MTDTLRSYELEAAIAGVVALRAASSWLPDLGMPDLAGIGASVSGAAAGAVEIVVEGVGHVASLVGWGRTESGLFVPAAPAILVGAAESPLPPRRSGPDDGRPRGGWADAIDVDALAAFLRAQHPAKPAQHVAALTGESAETVRKWLKRETRPGFRATLVLVCVYGLPLLEACLAQGEPGWIAEVRLGLDRARLVGELAALGRRIESVIGPGSGQRDSRQGGSAWSGAGA